MIEIITTIMGLIQGGLVWANKRSNWIFYCLQYIFLGIFSFTAHLYGDVTNSIFYFCVGITGWIFWNKNKGDTPIRKCNKKERIGYSVIIVVSTIIVYYFLMKTDDPLPLLDALTTTTSYIATFYMVTKKTDAWILWFINDVLYVIEYWLLPNQALYLMILNIIWTFMAVGSYITWNKIYRKQKEQNDMMKQLKIYFAGKFDLSTSGEKLYQRLINDYRSTLLGNSKKLTFADNSAKLRDYPIKYNGCFYCERASNGDYTSIDCEVVVKEETKAIMEADIFCCVFDLDFSVGTIVELMDAAFAQKRIVIFYKNEESNYAIKSDYWFAITRALEICKSNHTTIEVFGYDENVLPSIYNWLNNLVFTKRYVCIRKAKLDEYLIGSKVKNQYSIGNKQVTCYEKQGRQFIVEFYENGLIMIKTADAIQNKGFVNVTYDELYTDMSIQNGKIIVSNAVIEGTDGVGKTETINQLVHHGIVCKDRSELICQYMLFGISMKDRCLAYKDYLEHSTDKFVVFLVNNSKKELDERISRRGKNISEFDKGAYEYNVLYEETYIEMLKYQLTNPIELVDCTGLSIEEQVNKVKDCVLRRINHE